MLLALCSPLSLWSSRLLEAQASAFPAKHQASLLALCNFKPSIRLVKPAGRFEASCTPGTAHKNQASDWPQRPLCPCWESPWFLLSQPIFLEPCRLHHLFGPSEPAAGVGLTDMTGEFPQGSVPNRPEMELVGIPRKKALNAKVINSKRV